MHRFRFASRQLVVLALASLLAGCAHTQTRFFDPSSADTRAAINARSSRGEAVVTLATGEQITNSTLRVDAQEVSWTDAKTGEPRSVSLDALQSVRVPNRRSFVLRDLGVGLATGALAGFTLGSFIEPAFPLSQRDLQMLGVFGGTAIGVPVGALVGYEEGRTEYVIPTGSASARRSSGGG